MFRKLLAFAAVGVSCLFMAGCGVSESDICDTAQNLISEKFAEINPENPAKCVSVELTKQITETSWTAKAKLDNGTIIPISIKLHDNDILEVDYSAWLSKQIAKEFDNAAEEIKKEIDKEIDKAAKEFDKEVDRMAKEFDKEIDKEIDKATKEFDKELESTLNSL